MGDGHKPTLDRAWKLELREDGEARCCADLHVVNNIQTMAVPAIDPKTGRAILNPITEAPLLQEIVMGKPELIYVCQSELLLRAYKSMLSPAVGAQFKNIRTSLDVCRSCPWWRKRV